LGGHVAGGEDVAEKENLLVREPRRHLERPDVAEGHAHVLGLPAGIAAGEMRVAEEPRGSMSPELRGGRRVGVRALAEREELALAEKARAARDREGHDDAVADREIADRAALLDHLAHELV